MGIGGWKTQNNGLVTGALFSPPLVSRFGLVLCFTQNAAFTLLGLYRTFYTSFLNFLGSFLFGSVGLTIKRLEHICIHLVYPKFIYDLFQILTIRTLKVLHLPELLNVLFYLLGVMMELGN